MLELDARTVLITGGASGIGRACGLRAAELGANVVLVDVDEERLEATARDLGVGWRACDVSDVTAAQEVVRACVREFGRLDGLLSAAGVMQTKPLLDIVPDDFDRIFRVNVRGAFFVLQTAARQMVEAGGGSIVNVASTAGRAGRPLASHYAASKAAMINLTRSAATALGKHGVRVNAICPGLIETPMIQRIREERSNVAGISVEQVQDHWKDVIPMGRLGTVEEVADLASFLLSDAARYITGEAIGVTGGADSS